MCFSEFLGEGNTSIYHHGIVIFLFTSGFSAIFIYFDSLFAGFDMFHHLSVHEDLRASRTVELQNLKEVLYPSVESDGHLSFATLGAFPLGLF